jgi:hypothetical protein
MSGALGPWKPLIFPFSEMNGVILDTYYIQHLRYNHVMIHAVLGNIELNDRRLMLSSNESIAVTT